MSQSNAHYSEIPMESSGISIYVTILYHVCYYWSLEKKIAKDTLFFSQTRRPRPHCFYDYSLYLPTPTPQIQILAPTISIECLLSKCLLCGNNNCLSEFAVVTSQVVNTVKEGN